MFEIKLQSTSLTHSWRRPYMIMASVMKELTQVLSLGKNWLNHFTPTFPIYTLENTRHLRSSLIFSGGREKDNWHEVGLMLQKQIGFNPAGIYLLKVNTRNNRTRCEICLKLTIKTQERRRCLIVKFQHFSQIVNFEHVITS